MGFFSLFSSNKNTGRATGSNVDLDREFFMNIVDDSKSMMLYFYNGEGWIGANRTFFSTLGYENIDDFRERHESIRDVFTTESEEIFTESDKSWLDYIKKYQSNGYRVTLLNSQGKKLIIDAKCHHLSKDKKLYVLELEDVTALYEANIKTQDVEQLKTKFLANIGHEFRTPMNGILGFVELINQTHLDKRQHEYINMIHHSSKNLMTNIETLLDLSQLQGGRLEVSPQAFNILPEMEKIAYNFCMAGSQKGVKVLTFIDPKLPQEIVSDSKKINQIMYAIAQNAVKFTPRGGKVIIEVKLLKRQSNGDCSIGFSVRDSGKGISTEQISKIYEPFTSGSQADERLGVGLTLSNGLVDLLGSELRIQSKEGEGSYVNFVLDFKASRGQNYKMMPKKKVKVLLLDQKKVEEANFLTIYLRSFALDVVKSNQLDEHVYDGVEALYIIANQSDSSWMLQLGTYSKKTPVILLLGNDEKLQTKLTHIIDDVVRKPLLPSSVANHLYSINSLDMKELKEEKVEIKKQVSALVVEDNFINQKLIKILLQGYNIGVVTASDGVEAIEQCSKYKFDIIFMDIDLPEKNGIDATIEIKATENANKLVPIVALTAMAMEGDKEMLLEKGLDDYIPKPLNKDKLERVLNQYLKVTA